MPVKGLEGCGGGKGGAAGREGKGDVERGRSGCAVPRLGGWLRT